MKPETMMADGDECFVNHTSALECWLIMHSMRRVLNGGEDFPKRKGRLVHVASDPLQPKEIAFIEEMHAGVACPSVKMFKDQLGTVVGVTDFEVRETTTLPEWDGRGKPAILKIVLTHLGLPTELPISLSPADAARFAAETIYKLSHF